MTTKNIGFEFEEAGDVEARKAGGGERMKEPLYEAISKRLDKEKVKGSGFLVTLVDAGKRLKEKKRDQQTNPLTLKGFKVNVKAALDKIDGGKHKGKFSVKYANTEEEQLIIKRIALAEEGAK